MTTFDQILTLTMWGVSYDDADDSNVITFNDKKECKANNTVMFCTHILIVNIFAHVLVQIHMHTITQVNSLHITGSKSIVILFLIRWLGSSVRPSSIELEKVINLGIFNNMQE